MLVYDSIPDELCSTADHAADHANNEGPAALQQPSGFSRYLNTDECSMTTRPPTEGRHFRLPPRKDQQTKPCTTGETRLRCRAGVEPTVAHVPRAYVILPREWLSVSGEGKLLLYGRYWHRRTRKTKLYYHSVGVASSGPAHLAVRNHHRHTDARHVAEHHRHQPRVHPEREALDDHVLARERALRPDLLHRRRQIAVVRPGVGRLPVDDDVHRQVDSASGKQQAAYFRVRHRHVGRRAQHAPDAHAVQKLRPAGAKVVAHDGHHAALRAGRGHLQD
eukprot:1179311-Prorocentrum_minimum.AAC.2